MRQYRNVEIHTARQFDPVNIHRLERINSHPDSACCLTHGQRDFGRVCRFVGRYIQRDVGIRQISARRAQTQFDVRSLRQERIPTRRGIDTNIQRHGLTTDHRLRENDGQAAGHFAGDSRLARLRGGGHRRFRFGKLLISASAIAGKLIRAVEIHLDQAVIDQAADGTTNRPRADVQPIVHITSGSCRVAAS